MTCLDGGLYGRCRNGQRLHYTNGDACVAEVLKINPEKGECSILGDLGHGGWKYHGGVARLQQKTLANCSRAGRTHVF